ncbi:MAG: hypothetical protein M0Q92_11590 [Methanoregula sp.]|jgi:hypothetical protein|nr:hypothetical protein [Methanoregula sp.]
MDSSAKKTPISIPLAICIVTIFCGIVLILSFQGTRIPIGTCGHETLPMSFSTDIEPSFGTSFLEEFGAGEPDAGRHLPPIIDYPLRKQAIDDLMKRARIITSEDSIIGFYELPGSRLVLIDRETSVAEIVANGDGIQVYNLVPEPVGSRHFGADESGPAPYGPDLSSSGNTVTITRIDILLPGPGNVTTPLYIVRKTMTEQIYYSDRTPLAFISTTGTFYARYGERIDHIVSSGQVITDPQWALCSEGFNISMDGGRMGELSHKVRFARDSDRVEHVHYIATSPYIQIHDVNAARSASYWMSRDSSGCNC